MRLRAGSSLFLLVGFASGACDKPVAPDDQVPPGEVLKLDKAVGALPVNTTISPVNDIAPPNLNSNTIITDANSCICPRTAACQVCDPTTCAISDAPDGTACLDDGNACTRDVCKAGTCVHPVSNGATCDDGK